MAMIRIPRDMSLDKALRIFNSMVEKQQILSDLRKRQFYVKPSDDRRAQKMASRRKAMKNMAKEKAKEDRMEQQERRGKSPKEKSRNNRNRNNSF